MPAVEKAERDVTRPVAIRAHHTLCVAFDWKRRAAARARKLRDRPWLGGRSFLRLLAIDMRNFAEKRSIVSGRYGPKTESGATAVAAVFVSAERVFRREDSAASQAAERDALVRQRKLALGYALGLACRKPGRANHGFAKHGRPRGLRDWYLVTARAAVARVRETVDRKHCAAVWACAGHHEAKSVHRAERTRKPRRFGRGVLRGRSRELIDDACASIRARTAGTLRQASSRHPSSCARRAITILKLRSWVATVAPHTVSPPARQIRGAAISRARGRRSPRRATRVPSQARRSTTPCARRRALRARGSRRPRPTTPAQCRCRCCRRRRAP